MLEKRPVVGGNVRCELTIGGRLGQYKYFDMDKSIQAALAVVI